MGRETYSSLKATRQAWRVAVDVIHHDEPMPYAEAKAYCSRCGLALDAVLMEGDMSVECQRCLTRSYVPGAVAAEWARRRGIAYEEQVCAAVERQEARQRKGDVFRIMAYVVIFMFVALLMLLMAAGHH
jgi:hypothetical protein